MSTRKNGQNVHLSTIDKELLAALVERSVVAILVDGGFYRRRAAKLFGEKGPRERADELIQCCQRHVRRANGTLYRIFYYDCPPSEKVIYHPLTKKSVNLRKSDEYRWMVDFHREIVERRKVAFRRGEQLESQTGYQLRRASLKALLSDRITLAELTEADFTLDITQKGVDMRMGLDIAALAAQGRVDQIVMIAGDSDFVPAAKHARRSGIDFILDPMWNDISQSLNEHIDGLWQCVSRPPANERDPLHVSQMSQNESREDETTM